MVEKLPVSTVQKTPVLNVYRAIPGFAWAETFALIMFANAKTDWLKVAGNVQLTLLIFADRASMEPKSKVPLWLIYGSFMAHLWLIYGSFMAQSWLHHGSIHGSFVEQSWLIHGSFMAQFMAHLWNNHGSFMAHSYQKVFNLFWLKKLHQWWLNSGWLVVDGWLIGIWMSEYGANTVQTWCQHGANTVPNTVPNTVQTRFKHGANTVTIKKQVRSKLNWVISSLKYFYYGTSGI